MNKLEFLFKELQLLKMKYSKLNEREARGFNIFSILLKSGDEVNLHSKFIHELLNPNGSHHQGRLFLDLFIKELRLDISTDTMVAFREKDNIDILLKSSEQVIIIENKIYTEDHSYQLSRYWDRLHSQGYKKENIHLVYLTLFGHEPTQSSVREKVISISYRDEIIRWLERSIIEVSNIPVLRETLVQYLYLIQELTEQSTQKGFSLDVKDFLLKEDNLKTILDIHGSVVEAKIEIQFNFWQMLLANLIPKYAFSFYNANVDKGLKSSIRRYYQQQKNRKDYGIEYQVDENLYFFVELRDNIYYGFYFIDEEAIDEESKDRLDNLNIGWSEVSGSVYWKYPDKNLDFRRFNHQNVFDLIDSDLRAKDISVISDEIIGLIAQYHKDELAYV